jgi:allantoin racemase
MRIWAQVFSSRERSPVFHKALEEHLNSVADPGVHVEVHGTRKGGLGEHFRFFQAIDTRDIIDNILKCREAKGEQAYDAFLIVNSTDPALYEAREVLDIPVLGFLETASLHACMMGRTFSLVTTNPKFALSYAQKMKLYGLTERLVSVEAMTMHQLPAASNAYADPAFEQHVFDEFLVAARRAVDAGAEVIIPCGSFAVVQARKGVKEVDGALVIDGLAILVKMAETAVKIKNITGTFISRKLLYQMPGEFIRERAKKDYGIDLT